MKCDFLIVGGGMVGLSIAHQLIELQISKDIIIIDKESQLGLHNSGRNSGVLHAGLYYPVGSLRAEVCVKGSKRLRHWIQKHNLSINPCGKVVVPQKASLDGQLDILYQRGIANGAKVELVDEYQLREIIPEAISSSGRALWSPGTCVVNPLKVIHKLQEDLRQKGVTFIMSRTLSQVSVNNRTLTTHNNEVISYGHLINCAGLQADSLAHKFDIGKNYNILPFKGLYWQLKDSCPIKPRCNLYPVPDLNVPFLGVHFTPSADSSPKISIGPTATPALGRENYDGLTGIEPILFAKTLATLFMQYASNQNKLRRYVHEQAFLSLFPFLVQAAQELIPSIRAEYIERSSKVGIRAQLFDSSTKTLIDDFLCLDGPNSTHVLNAISPAFTASFELADLIINRSNF